MYISLLQDVRYISAERGCKISCRKYVKIVKTQNRLLEHDKACSVLTAKKRAGVSDNEEEM
jgi:hypothetical protein